MIITNMSILRGMRDKGLIKFHEQTGTKLTGLYGGKKFTCTYIDDICEGVSSIFPYKGELYTTEYKSGCFMPYVTWFDKSKLKDFGKSLFAK